MGREWEAILAAAAILGLILLAANHFDGAQTAPAKQLAAPDFAPQFVTG